MLGVNSDHGMTNLDYHLHQENEEEFLDNKFPNNNLKQVKDEDDDVPIILVTTIDLGEGCSSQIKLRERDDPYQAATDFCIEQNLPNTIILPLAQHIMQNLQRLQFDHYNRQKNQENQNIPPRKTSAPPKKPLYPQSHNPQGYTQTQGQRQGSYQGQRQKQGYARPQSAPTPNSNASPTPTPNPPKVSNALFERLYTESDELKFKKQQLREFSEQELLAEIMSSKQNMNLVSKELTKNRGVGEYDNYGERLYVEGLLNFQKKINKSLKRQKEVSANELDGATFQPVLTKKAYELKNKNRNGCKFQDRLYQGMSNKTINRLEQIRREREIGEVVQCTFRPLIDEKSQKLVTYKRGGNNDQDTQFVYQQLFQDAVRRQEKQKQYENFCPDDATFKPKINDRSMLRAYPFKHQQSLKSFNPNLPSNFGERLYSDAQQINQKLKSAREREFSFDFKTGQELFKPHVNKFVHQIPRNVENQSIGEYLYDRGKFYQDKMQQKLEELEKEATQKAQKVFTNQQSQKLVERTKIKQLTDLFNLLDVDRSGVVDLVGVLQGEKTYGGEDILSPLDQYARSDLEVATDFILQQNNDQNGDQRPLVDLQMFLEIMNQAIRQNSQIPRNYLVPKANSAKGDTDLVFAPQINNKSKILAKQKRAENVPVFFSLYDQAKQIREKLQRKSSQVEADIMQQCTFRPSLWKSFQTGKNSKNFGQGGDESLDEEYEEGEEQGLGQGQNDDSYSSGEWKQLEQGSNDQNGHYLMREGLVEQQETEEDDDFGDLDDLERQKFIRNSFASCNSHEINDL